MPTSIYLDRRRLIGRVIEVSIPTLLMFALINWIMAQAYALAIVEITLSGAAGILYWRLRSGDNLSRLEDALVVWAIVLLTSLVLLHSIGDSGLAWVAGYPFMAYFVKNVRQARYWTLFYLFGLLAITSLINAGLLPSPYTVTKLMCLMAVYIFFWIFAHIYQAQLELRQTMLEASNRALDDQKRHMQVILDHSPLGIWMIDTHGHMQFLNKTWKAWYGVSEEQASLAASYVRLLPEHLREQALSSDALCLRGEPEILYRQDVFTFGDGHEHVLDIIKVRCTDKEGRVTGLVGFAIDVTDKVHAAEIQKELERQVEHTQRLEALGVMAGGIAHDFNNLLTAVQGNVELAKLEPDQSPNMQECIASIESAAHAAADLCQQMLTYSGKGVLKSESMQIKPLIEDMRPLLEVSVGKHVSLAFDLMEGLPDVLGDRGQIRQVLLNMVLNAGEAIPADRQGRVGIGLKRCRQQESMHNALTGVDLPPGCYVELRIDDNGLGMSQEVQARMFEPFFTTKFTGRGLGMSAVLGILRLHNAGLEVTSEVGKGTSMRVIFPCMDHTAHPPSGVEKRGESGRAATVLLVDDEPSVLAVVRRMLERLGMVVVATRNGLEAVSLFGAEPDKFAWVLLDMTMPEMNGGECLKRLRGIRPDIHVVMSSGYNAETVSLPEDEAGRPNHFLTKPYTYESLRQVTQAALAASVSSG